MQKFYYDTTKPDYVTQPSYLNKIYIPTAPLANVTTSKGNAVNKTQFTMNLTEIINSSKTGDADCPDILINVYSNNALVASITNGAYCIVSVIGDT